MSYSHSHYPPEFPLVSSPSVLFFLPGLLLQGPKLTIYCLIHPLPVITCSELTMSHSIIGFVLLFFSLLLLLPFLSSSFHPTVPAEAVAGPPEL